MSKQYNKAEKRKRRKAYLKRKKAAAKAKAQAKAAPKPKRPPDSFFSTSADHPQRVVFCFYRDCAEERSGARLCS